MIQFSHSYMTTGRIIALIIWTFVSKGMSLLFNVLYRLVIDFLPRSKCLLISWLWPLSAIILETKKIKSVIVSIFSPFICHVVESPEYSFEGLMLKLKLQYFGYLMRRANSFEKTLVLGNIEGRRRRG